MRLPVDLVWLRKRVADELMNVPALLNEDVQRAKDYIIRHCSEIRMQATREGDQRFYTAEGEWFMAESEKVTGAGLNGDFRMVAGEGFEPSTFGL